MPKKIDLTGQKSGRLTVIEDVGRHEDGCVMWKCKCECGNTKIVITKHLRSGMVKSCGCLHREDLTGQKFGRLTVIERVDNDKYGGTRWKCKCDCGNETIVIANSLKKGATKSCGCLYREDLTGKKFGLLTVIEEAGRDIHGNTKWRCKCECGNETIVIANSLKKGATKSCGCLSELNIKKAQEKTKKDSLKEGTSLFNLTAKKSRNNTSGVKGVSWDKKSKKWCAQIGFKGKNYNLGHFTNKQDAINARKKAEEELFEPILEKYGKKKAD